MLVRTASGAWMVPAHQAIWIPAGVSHSITMLSEVATRSVYLESEAAVGIAMQCQVVGISPLLRQLLIEAVDLPSEYDPAGRAGKIMSLLVDEIRLAPVLPLSLPVPADRRHLHAAVPARDRADFCGLATPRLPVVGAAAAARRRTGDDDCL
jgi:hypothetical protein